MPGSAPSDPIAMLMSQGDQDMARRRGQRKGYLYRRGPSWFIQFREDLDELDENGKPKRRVVTKYVAGAGKGGVTRKQAERIAWVDYLSKVDQLTTLPKSIDTIRDFVKERFEPDVVWACKPGGKIHYKGMLKNHVLPALGNIRLRDVHPQHVQNLVRAKLEKGLSVQTVRHIRNTVSAIFRHAKRQHAYAGDLPTEGVRLPEMHTEERRALTWEQVKLVASHINRPDLEALVIVLALTGLRIGEALGLRWRRINLEGQPALLGNELLPGYTLAVRESYTLGSYGTLKSRSSRRNIPLSSEVWYQLSRLKLAAKFTAPDDPVFAGANGKPLDRHNVSNRWLKVAAKAAGVPWVSFHSFRHTSATLSDHAGLSVAERQRILGHASPGMTLEYTHADMELVRERMEQIGKGRVQ